MTEKIYLETFKKCPGLLRFLLLMMVIFKVCSSGITTSDCQSQPLTAWKSISLISNRLVESTILKKWRRK